MPTAFITHPSSLLHEMGPYHPECPERLMAISDRMIAAGIDQYLRHYTAPAASQPPGTIVEINREGIHVALPGGRLVVNNVRAASGGKVSAATWSAGKRLKKGDRFGRMA